MARTTLKQEQIQQQKLSQQNIQLFRMMEMNLLQFGDKVKEELDINPALEDIDSDVSSMDNVVNNRLSSTNDVSRLDDQQPYYKSYQTQNSSTEERDFFIPVNDSDSLISNLTNQLSYHNLSKDQHIIGEFIIGSLDDDGYLRRPIENIVDDLSFRQNYITDMESVEEVLDIIQDLDPPGIGARSLQECLTIQLRRRRYSRLVEAALAVVAKMFDNYTKKQFDKIQKRLNLSDNEMSEIDKIILSLNPKPTSAPESMIGKFIVPDFFVYRNDDKLELELHSYNKPSLSINSDFVEMLKKIKSEKKKSKSDQEAQDYVRDKIFKANVFISLIKERQETMVIVMNTILELQEDFFFSGEEVDLKPMTLKNIAEITNFDISTISRITSSKYVQTEFGIIPLKFLFSEAMKTKDGKEVSNRKIMKTIEYLINNEDKTKPYSDDQITAQLERLGFKIARRTTAKYRENLKIPSKHLRKQLI